MSFGMTIPSDFNIPVLWKDSSISHISKWHTKAGYFGNWCLLQEQPGICSRASSSQQKPFHRHEWELEHALLADCFRQSLCCPRRRGANETLDLSFYSLVEHNKHKTLPLKKKKISTLSERLQIFRKRIEEKIQNFHASNARSEIIKKARMGAVYQNA